MLIQTEEIQQAVNVSGSEKIRNMLHLQKALREENYEACAFWIERASRSGGTKREIAWLLRHPSWHIEEDKSLN